MVKVSFIVACYNYGQYISETIDSVLAQTYQDYEVVIVDDASNDGTTPAILAEQAKRDSRIKIITHAENKGLSATRNTAIKVAKGKYITGLDADDMVEPTYLEKVVQKMESTNADVVYTHFRFFDGKDETHFIEKDQRKIKRKLPYVTCFPMWSLHRKADWEAFGGYSEDLIGEEERDYWLYFVEANKNLVLVDEPLYLYRFHPNSHSSAIHKDREKIKKQIKQNHPNLYKGLHYYCHWYYFKYVMRPQLFQLRTRKGRRMFRLLGIVFYKD